jgi:hypothetical protein
MNCEILTPYAGAAGKLLMMNEKVKSPWIIYELDISEYLNDFSSFLFMMYHHCTESYSYDMNI